MADTNADGVYVIGKSGGMWGVADSEVEQRRGRATLIHGCENFPVSGLDEWPRLFIIRLKVLSAERERRTRLSSPRCSQLPAVTKR
jgi:hypothetical protein